MTDKFSHLHVHSEYSLHQGVGSVEDWIGAARDKGVGALAFTESGNMASAMAAYLECLKDPPEKLDGKPGDPVKCIFGMQIEVVSDIKSTASGDRIVLLAANETGYKNLLRANRYGWTKGYVTRSRKPRLDYRVLKPLSKGLFALTGSLTGPLARALVVDFDLAVRAAQQLQAIFGKRLLAEFQLHDTDDQRQYNNALLRIATSLGLRRVVTCDCRYPLDGQHLLADALSGMAPGRTMAKVTPCESSKWLMSIEDLEEQRRRAHPYITPRTFADMIETTCKVGNLCNVELEVGKHQLPIFDRTKHELCDDSIGSNEELFLKIAKTGFAQKISRRVEATPEGREKLKQYRKQFAYEIEVISNAQFTDYFLIVEDIIRWSKNNNIEVGAARGSVAGSLVAYCMGITDIDPLRFDLMFERFLNPGRLAGERAKSSGALPDIDLDFEQTGRPDVKGYIDARYGKDHVCTIGTYTTLKPKSLLKNLHRSFDHKVPTGPESDWIDVSVQEINRICQAFGDEKITSIEQAKEDSPEFQDFYKKFPYFVDYYCVGLEGQIVGTSRHAAGVLITPTPIVDWVPVRVQKVEGEEGYVVVSQWEDTFCEQRGLLKFDVLGIKSLDVVKYTCQLIRERQQIEIDLSEIDLNDENVLAEFSRGATEGVPQFNSDLQSGFLQQLVQLIFEDLITSNALLRPGPMAADAHNLFVKLKRGEIQPEYDHPDLEEPLASRYGLYIFQEDVTRAAHIIGRLSLIDADMLRAAISKKKDPSVIEGFRVKFVAGAQLEGLTEERANEIFTKFVAWSSYGFNRCLPADARILMADGSEQRIQTLYRWYRGGKEIVVLSYDREQQRFIPHRVRSVYKTGHRPIATFTLKDTGRKLRCTWRHGILTAYRGFRVARDLRSDDQLCYRDANGSLAFSSMDLSKSFHDDTHNELTYDIEMVTEPHNFVADSVVVHNSHACSYAVGAFRCQWLRVYFPLEFWTATLEYAYTDPKKHENLWTYRRHIERQGFEFDSPDALRSNPKFHITDEDRIAWPIIGIKGLGEKTAKAVATAVAEHSPQTLAQFYDVIPRKTVNKGMVGLLIKAGALSRFGNPVDVAREYFFDLRNDKKMPPEFEVDISDVMYWESTKDKVLGYIDVPVRERLSGWFDHAVVPLSQLADVPTGTMVFACGVVSNARAIKRARGTFLFADIYDKDGEFTLFCGYKYYSRFKPSFKKDDIIQVFGYRDETKEGGLQISLMNDQCEHRVWQPDPQK